MAKDDSLEDTDKFLAGIDFSALATEQKEKHKKEIKGIFLHLLEIIDALQALEVHCQALLHQGHNHVPLRSVQTILHLSNQKLLNFEIVPISTVGNSLDLDLHEVVSVSKDSVLPSDTVMEEMLRGYLWNGELLRQAKVVVSGNEENFST